MTDNVPVLCLHDPRTEDTLHLVLRVQVLVLNTQHLPVTNKDKY